ncbi:hypothetical protein M3J09_002353 [Ascochyta lentis]
MRIWTSASAGKARVTGSAGARLMRQGIEGSWCRVPVARKVRLGGGMEALNGLWVAFGYAPSLLSSPALL